MTYQSEFGRSMSLYTRQGERKYLCASERDAFYRALNVLSDPKDRSFCEMIFWTGCRPSEALALSAVNIDLADGMVVIRSLKKRGKLKGRHFRPVPVPLTFLCDLENTHAIRRAQEEGGVFVLAPLWPFSRTTGWKRMRQVMDAAGLSGERASAKGLRHTYGVHAAMQCVPETRIQKWLGHASLSTTGIYLEMAAPEDRTIAERMWAA